jgi:hypothetical protein
VNTKRKGDTVENRLIYALEAMGYICEKARAVRYRWGDQPHTKVYDFFCAPGMRKGAFDIVAIHPQRRTFLANVTTDNVTIASKARDIEPVRRFINPDHVEAAIVRWIAPELPGQRGQFGVYRIIEDFEKRHLLEHGAACFPWEAAEVPIAEG